MIIYLAGGCFDRMSKIFSDFGELEIGFINSEVPYPTYREVSGGRTYAAEGIRLNTSKELKYILDTFFENIDPSLKNRQGPDIGTQYRTGIYAEDDSTLTDIENYVEKKKTQYRYFYTEVMKLKNFYPISE